MGDIRIRETLSELRTAALFHDIGKTALNCMLLKSSRTLRETEYNLIKYHTIFGASLFREAPANWGPMAGDICLNHHEKWDGSGYPGRIIPDYANQTRRWFGKKGRQIPLVARIVALIDVYDALSAHRSYKNSWPDQKIKRYFREQSGRHFDPQLVNIFLSHYQVFKNVMTKSV
jgi:HD-GYP domain-containing protein (c-di-GMP phosphodiesterase class II)